VWAYIHKERNMTGIECDNCNYVTKSEDDHKVDNEGNYLCLKCDKEINGNTLTFTDVTDNIVDAMTEMDGKTIAEIHNQICSNKVEYLEDSQWKSTGESDA
jgi:DNA-directed RNA polymerase subunit RPC12/RpoP